MQSPAELCKLKIAARPKKTWRQTFKSVLSAISFSVACFMINSAQFMFLLPLWFLPFRWTRELYDEGVRYTKGAFAKLLILMVQWWAPTEILLSFEMDGPGRLTEEDIQRIVVRNQAGEVVALNLPQKTVLIGNHQAYPDWWYAWAMLYYVGAHKDVFIVLKHTLKWIPILGWGMKFFGFIFLARSWAADRVNLLTNLGVLAHKAEEDDRPLVFIIYPEGTLVSSATRPASKKYADKMGIPDMTHMLLPRSTGLHYSLRALSPPVPSLHMIDLTVAYPGIPPMGYGQSYYTLRSIFLDGVPPPVVHTHLRLFNVARDVPVGNVRTSNGYALPHSAHERETEVDIPEAEKETFDLWLRDRWHEKDELLSRYHETGSFVLKDSPSAKMTMRLPLKLRRKREILDAFCFFIPAIIAWQLWAQLRRAFSS